VVKHLRILFSYPTLYIIPYFRMKGSDFLANFYFKLGLEFLASNLSLNKLYFLHPYRFYKK
jgi:hypothetical protein